MNREEKIKVIINELVKLKSIIETENKLNLTDKNIFLEDIVKIKKLQFKLLLM